MIDPETEPPETVVDERASDMLRLRAWWERWGPTLTGLLALIGALVGATYYLSAKITALDSVKASVENLQKEISDAGDDISSLSLKVERLSGYLETADREHESIRRQQGENARRYSDDIRTIMERLTRLEVSLKLSEFMSSGQFEGAALRTPEGTKFYSPEQTEEFRRDAGQAIGSGGGFTVREMVYSHITHKCVPGSRPDCIYIGFVDVERGLDLGHEIEARLLSPERLAALSEDQAGHGGYRPCRRSAR